MLRGGFIAGDRRKNNLHLDMGRGAYRGVQCDATEMMDSLARLPGLSSVLDCSPDFVEADGAPLRAGVVALAQGKPSRRVQKMRTVHAMRFAETGRAAEVGAHLNDLRSGGGDNGGRRWRIGGSLEAIWLGFVRGFGAGVVGII